MSAVTAAPKPLARKAIRAAVVLLAAALGAGFFGLAAPFTLIALGVLPSLSVAGVIYVAVGGLAGLVFGAWTSAASLARSERLVTPWCAALLATLAMLDLAALAAARWFDAFAHV